MTNLWVKVGLLYSLIHLCILGWYIPNNGVHDPDVSITHLSYSAHIVLGIIALTPLLI